MRLTIKIIATKGFSAFSVSTISIFSTSKSPKPESNKNIHFFHLLSEGLKNMHKNTRNLRITYIEDIWTTIYCFTLTFCMEVYTHRGIRMTKRYVW